MKVAMIIDENLPLGLMANTAAVLGVSLGHSQDSVVGWEVVDADGSAHAAITNTPIPLLAASADALKEIRTSALKQPQLQVIDFCETAQTARHYEQYAARLAQQGAAELCYRGICLCGPTKQVNQLTGSLRLLR